jgi:long-chain acyl-CoA synthetase
VSHSTIVEALRRAERYSSAHEAVACGDIRYTYRQQLDRLRRLATLLGDLGTAPGDRVAMLSGNSIALVELYLAIPATGRVEVPLNFRWADPELAYALEDSGAEVLFCDRDPGKLADKVGRVIRIDTGELDELIAAASPGSFADDLAGDTLAGLFYTGGTTGASKGVMLTHGNLMANAVAMQLLTPLEPEDVYVVIAPIFHAAGSISLLQCILAGCREVVVPVFDAGAILDLIEAEGASMTVMVPTMVAAVVEEQLVRPRDMSSMRFLMHGGSPIATETVRRAVQAFPTTELVHVYGCTETSPLFCGMRHEERNLGTARERSAGIPVMGYELAIRAIDGTELPPGEAGEVTARGANVMAGYWNKPEATGAALRDGWYWTGDIGTVDEEGNIYLLDRSKDMIISGGENVYCTEVEEVLYRHPAVLEAAVFGIPHETWGETVHAQIVLRTPVDADELVAFCREHIAGYKVPRSIAFQDEPLPKSGPGKVLKRELRTTYWEGRDGVIA